MVVHKRPGDGNDRIRHVTSASRLMRAPRQEWPPKRPRWIDSSAGFENASVAGRQRLGRDQPTHWDVAIDDRATYVRLSSRLQ